MNRKLEYDEVLYIASRILTFDQYIKFINSIKSIHGDNKSLFFVSSNDYVEEILYTAFNWCDSAEGGQYWSNITKKLPDELCSKYLSGDTIFNN